MTVVRFYQVAGEGPGVVDAVLPALLEKALAAGDRVGVVCPTAARVSRLDESLWTYAEGSFLPHGVVGGGDAGVQPVVLGGVEDALEDRLPVVLAGAEAAVRGALGAGVVKCLYVFDSSAASVARSRELWKELKGQELVYFAQEGGRWVARG